MRKLILFLTLAWLAGMPLPGNAAAPAKPNILWICADDHAAYVCGAYGNTKVRTPNLDRLASQGMRFDRAYCNSPVCTASRQSFLTGRYPRTIGVTQLSTPLPESETTLAELLRDAGYDTAAIGKMHFNSNLKHGFDLRLDLPDYNQHIRRQGKRPVPSEIDVLPQWRPIRDPARIWLNGFYRPYGAYDNDMAGTFFARHAEQFLQAKRDKPFFLMASFVEPHSPFHFPVEYRGRHDPGSFAVPKVGPEDDWQIPAIFRDLTEKDKQGIIASYYTSTEFLDKNVGVVLESLQKSGKEGETLVIYTGDHGYMLGQHGRFEKHCSYEPAVRSPLFARFPGRVEASQASNAFVEFVDILPTVLNYAGVQVPKTVQGKSLVDVLSGRARTHRDHVIVEYAENEEAMIRNERWKLVYCTGKRERQDGYTTGRPLPGRTVRLFDLQDDPEEMMNVAGKPENAAVVQTLTTQLAKHMKRTARQPDLLPHTDDIHLLLDFCLKPTELSAKVGRMSSKPFNELATRRILPRTDLPPDLADFYSRHEGLNDNQTEALIRIRRLEEVKKVTGFDIRSLNLADWKGEKAGWGHFSGFLFASDRFFGEIIYVIKAPCSAKGSIVLFGYDVMGAGTAQRPEGVLVLANSLAEWLSNLRKWKWVEYGTVPGETNKMPKKEREEIRQHYRKLNEGLKW